MLPGFDLRYHIALRWSAGVGLIALAIDMSLLWSERQNRIASDRYVGNRRGEVSKSSGLGNPTPTNSTVWWCLGFLSVQSVESDESVIQTKRTCRPSGALVCLVYAAFYKHVAPLGLNAPVILLSSGLGNPTPTNSTVWWCLGFLFVQSVESDESVIQTKRTCRPSGALVCLVYAAFYKHVAPLGLNTPVILLSSGLGNPTPTHPASLAHVPIFVPPGSPIAPLGLLCIWCMPRAINMPPRWGFRKKENEKTGQIPARYTHCAPLERGDWTYCLL